MKSERELRKRLDNINLMLSDELEFYLPKIKAIDLKRERYFLEEILEIKHEDKIVI